MSKAGETGYFLASLFNGSTAESFANAAAFSAAGYSIVYTLNGAIATLGTFTCAVLAGTSGVHAFTYTRQGGVEGLVLVPPAGRFADPNVLLGEAETYDLDSIASLLLASSGAPVANSRAVENVIEITESDAFLRELTFPLAILSDWGYSDLSAAGWSLQCTVRDPTDTGTTQPPTTGAVLTALVSNGASRLVTVSAAAFPATLALSASDIEQGSKTWKYDVQAQITESFNVTAVSTGAGGTFTVAGDQRKRFARGGSFTITGSTNNNATWTVDTTNASIALTGGNTVIKVIAGQTVGAVADGAINVVLRLTGIRGDLVVHRQEDRQ